MTTKWPGLNEETAAVFDRVLSGRVTPQDLTQYNIRPAQFFHRVDLATGGFTSETFFNVAESEYVTNWPGGSGLAEENALWMTHFGFNIEHAHDVAYAAIAGARLIAGTTAAGSVTMDQVEDVRGLVQAGRVVGTIGSRTFVDGHGLENYPLGIGVVTPGALAYEDTNTTAIGNQQAFSFSIGAPELSNKYALRYPIAALPGKTLRVRVTMDTAITVAAAVVLVCQVEGILVSPANL